MAVVILMIVLALAALTGMVLLQIFLSKKESKWLGLILPIVSFVLSFMYPLNMISTGDTGQDIWMFAITLLLSNIITIILLVIYFACRENRRKKAQLDKMKIQDLQ